MKNLVTTMMKGKQADVGEKMREERGMREQSGMGREGKVNGREGGKARQEEGMESVEGKLNLVGQIRHRGRGNRERSEHTVRGWRGERETSGKERTGKVGKRARNGANG